MTVCSAFSKAEEGAMLPTEMIRVQRSALRERAENSFVQREEFCRLLLSCRKMVRADEPAVSVRGLLDVTTGIRFLIEQENLLGR
jgi:hypothetical protein